MKNIHIIPTLQPSKLFIWMDTLLKINAEANNQGSNQHIYITSNEEIKEGYWCIDTEDNIIFKVKEQGHSGLLRSENDSFVEDSCKKIILTTNQDVIKDCVQSIPDEFLEWFVKNSSCEKVEILLKNFLMPLGGERRWWYEITIPKEEPRQETLEESNQTTAIRFLEWYRRRGIIYQFHTYHIPMDDRKYLNSRQLFEVFKEENYER